MDPNVVVSGTGDAQNLNDIQTYLASFNKDLGVPVQGQEGGLVLPQGGEGNFNFINSDGTPLGQTGDGSGATIAVVQNEDGTTQLIMTGQPAATPVLKMEPKQEPVAAQTPLLVNQPVVVSGNQVLATQTPVNIQPQINTDNAESVQVLTSVSASTIPEASASDTVTHSSPQPQLVTMQPATPIQPVAVASSTPQASSSIPVAASASSDSSQQNVVLNTGNSYQTVTIVPSEVNQGGEVSYVLIVSQPDGEKPEEKDVDMSIYDFKNILSLVREEEGAKGSTRGAKELIGEDDDSYDEEEKKKIMATARAKKMTPGSSGQQLMCNYCNYTSPKRYLLTRHMKTHSEERPHKCNICDRGFKTVASLQNHINTHTGVRPHKCKECESAFTTSGELVRHVRYRHTFEKPHKCTECDYCSVELSKLKRHMRSHTGERPYQCPHCSYASPDTYKLKRHLRIHTGEKPYQCDVCQARFTQSNSLKAHKLIHTGNKPVFQCELCPTTCGRKTDLKIHVQKLHTSEKPLACKKCGKAFPDRYTYKIHLKTHEGEKCFKCELCPYAALSQRHLESHILTHTGEKPYQCKECDQSFRQKQLLKRHRNLYHTPDYIAPPPKVKSYECAECNKTFAHRGNLLRHMALHDPDNPEYQNIDIDLSEEEEDSDEEYGDGMQQVQYVQMIQNEDGTVTQNPIQLQLVTDESSGTQVLLQMEGSEGQGQQVQGQIVQGIDGQQVIQVTQPMAGTSQQSLNETGDGEDEEEPIPGDVETPPPNRIQILKREESASNGAEEEQDEDKEEVATPARTPRGKVRQLKMDDDEAGEEGTPRRSGRKRVAIESPEPVNEVSSPKKKVRTLPARRNNDELKKEEQKKKDIEECFGFGVDDE